MSQLKLTLTRDPRVSTPKRQFPSTGEKVSSSVAVVDLVGGASSSKPVSPYPALNQTHLFTGKPKLLPVVPRLTVVPGKTGSALSETVPTQPRQEIIGKTSEPSQSSLSGHTKLFKSTFPLSHTKSPSSQPLPSQFAHAKSPLSPHPSPLSSRTKPSLLAKVPTSLPHISHAKPLPLPHASHAKPLPSPNASYAKSPSHAKPLLLPHASYDKLPSHGRPSLSPHAKLPSPAKPPSLQSSHAQHPPRVTSKTTKVNHPGVKTITVKLPPSLLGSVSLPVITSSATPTFKSTHGVPITSQMITVKLPSLPTSTTTPFIRTSSSLPHAKMNHPPFSTSVTHATDGDQSLSPPKPKKQKVMKTGCDPTLSKKPKVVKTSLLPISRIKTIMKTNIQSSQPSLQLSQEAVLLIAKATVSSSFQDYNVGNCVYPVGIFHLRALQGSTKGHTHKWKHSHSWIQPIR